ncbi:MAG: lysine--tRNA ligase [Spirochaetaceae bacterium]|nr:MAG: lysine--tRNA ligase [Spirochaetaceae bacterium]
MSKKPSLDQSSHWADVNAARIVRERGPKPHYTCASGITPSGTIHIGNFREIISVELVARALRDRGQKVRFIYSWDDYDVFRKVPANIPNAEAFDEYLRWPIVLVPDPWRKQSSFARANEVELESVLPELGVEPEYIYQARQYRTSVYAKGIRTALEHRETIRGLLNEHRTHPLPDHWWPISVFSTFCGKDTTTVLEWDGEWNVRYRCDETGNEETLDLRTTGAVKLLWRIDWPMRWKHEDVDFEPAGKEHHSAGGSFDTARTIARQVYGQEPPVTFKYDFISIKGRGGKISSSSGDVVSVRDVLEVYQPEVVRHLFVGTRPNAEFAISFDLDVIKIYEDYDRCERIYFGIEEVGEKRRHKEARIYELSQVGTVPRKPSLQIPFRHFCNLLQITAGDIDRAIDSFPGSEALTSTELQCLRRRGACCWNWINRYAPEDFRFTLKSGDEPPVSLGVAERAAVAALAEELRSRIDQHDEKSLAQTIYDIAAAHNIEAREFFRLMYRVLVGKDQGPRLAGFLITLGAERVLRILRRYQERGAGVEREEQ